MKRKLFWLSVSILTQQFWMVAICVLVVLDCEAQEHPGVLKSPACQAVFSNIVVPNACLGRFRHGTQVFKDASGNLSVTESPQAERLTHPGVDLVAPPGSPIYAFADGIVEDLINSTSDSRWGEPQKKGLGYAVLIQHSQQQHGKETYSIYLHMNQPPSVTLGQRVSSGRTVLGYVGETGAAWGNHTHFEIRHFGSFVLTDASWSSPPNIYGKDDKRESDVFRREWEDPRALFLSQQIAGKWWTADQKEYLEFLPDGECSFGRFSGSAWQVNQGNVELPETRDGFWCHGGSFSTAYLMLNDTKTLTSSYGMQDDPVKYYRGLQGPKPVPPLTLTLAQRLLRQNINMMTAQNTLMTCRACFDPEDKQDNDKAPLVSTYSGPLIPFLTRQGYIQNVGGRQVFTAKAKRSTDYGFGGFRIANFENPRILTTQISDPNQVPIDYDFVPTALTMPIFGRVQRIKSVASFSYSNEAWQIRVAWH